MWRGERRGGGLELLRCRRRALAEFDEETIRARIELRPDDDWFGKRPDELERIFLWNEGYTERYRGFGAVIIDATEPLPVVVDTVIAAAGH